jgi:hypothetical protein
MANIMIFTDHLICGPHTSSSYNSHAQSLDPCFLAPDIPLPPLQLTFAMHPKSEVILYIIVEQMPDYHPI